jgi:hypothetical protein
MGEGHMPMKRTIGTEIRRARRMREAIVILKASSKKVFCSRFGNSQ